MWQPRWYYKFINKNTNVWYVGQHLNDDVGETYFGTGSYWIKHCKKNGGYNSDNLYLVEKIYFNEEHEARKWLDDLESKEGEYWLRTRKDCANQIPENTLDSPLIGGFVQKQMHDRRKEEQRLHHWEGDNNPSKIKSLNKSHQWGKDKRTEPIGNQFTSETATLTNKKRVNEGTHNFSGDANPQKIKLRCVVTGEESTKSGFTYKARKRMGLQSWPHPLEIAEKQQ
jgi:hypothetical protein